MTRTGFFNQRAFHKVCPEIVSKIAESKSRDIKIRRDATSLLNAATEVVTCDWFADADQCRKQAKRERRFTRPAKG